MNDEFPKMLYRYREGAVHAQGTETLHGVPCDTLVVESEEEEAEARADGWCGSPAEADEAKPAPTRKSKGAAE